MPSSDDRITCYYGYYFIESNPDPTECFKCVCPKVHVNALCEKYCHDLTDITDMPIGLIIVLVVCCLVIPVVLAYVFREYILNCFTNDKRGKGDQTQNQAMHYNSVKEDGNFEQDSD